MRGAGDVACCAARPQARCSDDDPYISVVRYSWGIFNPVTIEARPFVADGPNISPPMTPLPNLPRRPLR